MWKGLQDGWRPPNIVTKDEYYYIKEHKDENPALTGFVGFGCSFGGKWFGGFATNKRGDSYCSQARNTLIKDFEGVKNAIFTCLDYRDVIIPDDVVVYCDPLMLTLLAIHWAILTMKHFGIICVSCLKDVPCLLANNKHLMILKLYGDRK